jgi:uncharacterized protein (TIGR02145 family)
MFNRNGTIAAIILLAFCSFAYGQEKQRIAFIFVGEEPKKGIFKPFSSQMQMATMKKYATEDRTAEFRKLAVEGNESQVYKAVSQWGVKYVIFIEISEAIEGYYLEAKMMNVENSEIVKISIAESKLENSKEVSIAAQEIVAGLLEFSENSSSSMSNNISYEIFTDPRDNQSYEIIKKGNLIWMTKNMNYKTGKYWCYGNESFNCEKYGKLYDWHTAMEVCPNGWKLPSRSEWNDLIRAVGKEIAGKKLKSREMQGTDDFGFSALLGGRRNVGGSFDYLREDGRWWTSTTTPEGSNAYYQYMNIRMDYIDENLRPNDFSNGYSVRCVMGSPDVVTATSKSPASSSGDNNISEKSNNSLTDPRDNQNYKVIKIGDLTWIAENMNYKTGTSWCYNDEDFNCEKYGRLYDWNAAMKACPSGWHLPKHAEWTYLVRTVNDDTENVNSRKTITGTIGSALGLFASASILSVEGMKKNFTELMDNVTKFADELPAVEGNVNAGERLKSKEFNGTNTFGFSALASGGRNNEVKFYYIGKGGAWWTATENKDNKKEAYDIFIFSNEKSVREGIFSKSDGYSVRCVKDRNKK